MLMVKKVARVNIMQPICQSKHDATNQAHAQPLRIKLHASIGAVSQLTLHSKGDPIEVLEVWQGEAFLTNR